MRVRVEGKMLAVVVVLVFFSVCNGLIVDKCDLKDKLMASLRVKNPDQPRRVTELTCHSDITTGFNTSAINQVPQPVNDHGDRKRRNVRHNSRPNAAPARSAVTPRRSVTARPQPAPTSRPGNTSPFPPRLPTTSGIGATGNSPPPQGPGPFVHNDTSNYSNLSASMMPGSPNVAPLSREMQPDSPTGAPPSGGMEPGSPNGAPPSGEMPPGFPNGAPPSGGMQPGSPTGAPPSGGMEPGFPNGAPPSGGMQPGSPTGASPSGGMEPGFPNGAPPSGGMEPDMQPFNISAFSPSVFNFTPGNPRPARSPIQMWTLYGIFQLSDHVACTSNNIPSLNLCELSCDQLLDDDITDDIDCLNTIFSSFNKMSNHQDQQLIKRMMSLLICKECADVKYADYFSKC